MTLDVVVYTTGRWWARPWEKAFISGLRAHGIEPEYRHEAQGRVSDLAVIWSHRNQALFNLQKKYGKDYLVMERGYVGDRYKWAGLCFNGLNGYAQWLPAGDNGERWEKHFWHRLVKWHDGDYALVCGQVPGDASIVGLNVESWVREQCAALIDKGYRVRYRPHPQYGGRFCPAGVELSTEYLPNDLKHAALAVTYNSNSGVDAVIHGVPTVALDKGSMAWDVTSHSLDDPLFIGDRKRWAHWIAWCQWQQDEIASGAAWDYLKQRYENRATNDRPDERADTGKRNQVAG